MTDVEYHHDSTHTGETTLSQKLDLKQVEIKKF